MAEITRERVGELQRGAFQILIDNPDGLQAKEVLEQMTTIVPPTEFESTYYPKTPNVRRYEKMVRFATIPTVKAGWLVKEKGIWTLTDEGIAAYKAFPDPAKFAREAIRLYRQWKKDQPIEEPDEIEEITSETSTTLEEAEEGAWAEIRDYLLSMNPYDFQDLVAGLLRGMNYHISYIAPPGPDKGIDIIGHSDPLGVTGTRIKVQVKRRQDKSSVNEVRAFVALLGDEDVGLFVSSGGFTREAEQEARGQYAKRLILIGLTRLFDLWVEHYDKIPEGRRRLLPLKPIYYLLPED